jgi:hypothetical protein
VNGFFTKGGYPPFSGYSGTMVSGGGGGSGDVTGPGSATDTAVARFNGTSGKIIENSLVIVSDVGNVGVPADGYYNFDTSALGTTGYGFRDNSGTVEFKNDGGGWTPIPSSVTSGANTFKVDFNFNTASPVTIASLAIGDVVMIGNCTVSTAFDDGSATLQLGVAGTLGAVLDTGDVSPGNVANYQSLTPYIATANTNLILTITPAGATQGAGTITCLIHKV